MANPMVMMNPLIAGDPKVLSLISQGRHRTVLVHLLAHIHVTQHATEGQVHRLALPLLHGRKSDAAALVDAGLWVVTESGWGVIDWADNQMHRPRVPVPKAVRARVFERDGFVCCMCGSTNALSIDHILPWVLGGTNALENLQTLCIPCNSKKKDNY